MKGMVDDLKLDLPGHVSMGRNVMILRHRSVRGLHWYHPYNLQMKKTLLALLGCIGMVSEIGRAS